jgi:Spermidine synthase
MKNVTILEGYGLRSLHFSTTAVQGLMRIESPDEIVLEYVQQMMMWMLFREQVPHIVQLGLGSAALTKFCYRHFPNSEVTAVELDPDVIRVCREHFALTDNDDRLTVLNMDALDYVGNFSRRRTIDVLQVDIYDAQANGPALSSAAFYAACGACLKPDGIMTVNLYCDSALRLENIQAMQKSFEAVAWLPEVHDGNVVAIAFKRAPSVDFEALYRRADQIAADTGMPASSWVDGLQSWMQGDLDIP